MTNKTLIRYDMVNGKIEVKPEDVRRAKSRGIGLGDIFKAVTDRLGIPQCGGCKDRQKKLNRFRF